MHRALLSALLEPPSLPTSSYPANRNDGRQGPGPSKVRTESARIAEGHALRVTLDGRPWSGRRLADVLGIGESIVRRWCSGEKPIPAERLKEACPVVWSRWRAQLAVIRGEESAA